MTTATNTNSSYHQQAAVKQTKTKREKEVIFVPTFFDLQTPIKKGLKVFQFRRQVSEFLDGLINGAASLR